MWGALALGLPFALGVAPGRPADQLARIVLGAALGAVAFTGVLRGWRSVPEAWLARAFALAALGRLLLLALPPLLSEDLWRYLWDGAMQHLGHGPYDHAPNSPALDAAVSAWPALQDVRDQIGHAAIPTIYPPAAQLAFRLATLAGPSPLVWRAMAASMEFGAAFALTHWLRRSGRDPRAVLLWLFCPLPALEAAVGGHVDALGVLGLCLAGALLAAGPARGLLAGGVFALAVGAKLFPAVALPRLGWRVALGCGLASALFALPYLGGTPAEALSTYGHRWRGNDGLFALLVHAFEQVWPPGPTPVELPAMLTRVGRWLVGPAPGFEALGPLAPLWPDELAFAAAKLVAGVLLGLVVVERLWRGRDLERVLGPITATLLLVAPVAHPWYLLWWLPFAVLATAGGERRLSWPFWVWSVTVWIAYVPRVALLDTGTWTFPSVFAVVEYIPVWIALVSAVAATVKPGRPST